MAPSWNVLTSFEKCGSALTGGHEGIYSAYGSFLTLGDPKIDPNILILIYGDPQKGTPNFGKPPYNHYNIFPSSY